MLSSEKKRVFELLQAVTEPFDPPTPRRPKLVKTQVPPFFCGESLYGKSCRKKEVPKAIREG